MKPHTLHLVAFSLLCLSTASRVTAQDGAPPLVWVGAGQYDMSGVDVSADGATIVTSSYTDETIKVWKPDGTFVRTLTGPVGGIQIRAGDCRRQTMPACSAWFTVASRWFGR